MSIKFLTWLSTYVIIVLCELGDKTQVAVLLLTSKNPSRRWLIFAASSIALVLCVIIEVTVGVTLARYLGPATINRIAGVIFLILGIATLVSVVNTGNRHLPGRANLAEEGHNSI